MQYLLAVLCCAVSVATAANPITVTPSQDGSLMVGLEGQAWFHSTPPAFRTTASKWVSAADGSLIKAGTQISKASDALGDFVRTDTTWLAGDLSFETSVVEYVDVPAAAFYQTWTSGVADLTTSTGGTYDDVCGAFPSLNTSFTPTAPLGLVEWHGRFINDGAKGASIGSWPTAVIRGIESGPMAAFTGNGSADVLVWSPIQEFMAGSWADGPGLDTLAFGPLGSASSIPAGFTTGAVVFAGNAGITNTMQAWGSALLKKYGKATSGPADDFTLNYLGYSTDHGAYYYYNPVMANYNETLVAVKKYAEDEKIPYRHILLDSWWYFKGVGNGVKNWTAMPDIFPPGGTQGLADFNALSNWPVVGHNRYWSNNSDYAKQNGGQYLFSNDLGSEMIVPLEQAFWDFLMSSSKKWGLAVYEQDWLYNELEGVPALTKNITLGRTWLTQMGTGAAKSNLTIQYCMSYPRHAMQSVEIPAVTQIRASDDYVPGQTEGENQWRIGGSSIFAHALALAPSKDNFWSMAQEHGGSRSIYTDDSYVRQAAVSTLSTGPVTPGDGINYSNASLIMRSCRADGLLLKPHRPAVTLDEVFAADASPNGEVTVTYSMVGSVRYDILLAALVTKPFSVTPSMLRVDRDTAPSTGFAAMSSSATKWGVAVNTTTLGVDTIHVVDFSSDPLPIDQSMNEFTFQLWHVVPATSYGAFLGELSTKWVPVSSQRFSSIKPDDASKTFTVVAHGSPGEALSVWFATKAGNAVSPVEVKCSVGSSGSVTITWPTGSCSSE